MKFDDLYPNTRIGESTPEGVEPRMFRSPIPYYCEGCHAQTAWFDERHQIRCCSTECREKIMRKKGVEDESVFRPESLIEGKRSVLTLTIFL